MSRIKHKIIIASGKGGFGKAHSDHQLSSALKSKGYAFGLIDADITGPSNPKLLAIEDQRMIKRPYGIRPGDAKGIWVASMALLLSVETRRLSGEAI
jgi:ATP-binding protein involved in chromosome partitioning